jgi:hypothetical protein
MIGHKNCHSICLCRLNVSKAKIEVKLHYPLTFVSAFSWEIWKARFSIVSLLFNATDIPENHRQFFQHQHSRNEADENSDVDILVDLDYSHHIGLGFVQMKLDLEEKLNKPVDLVSSQSIFYFPISIRVPSGVCIYRSSISSFVRAMHPVVQSFHRWNLPINP